MDDDKKVKKQHFHFWTVYIHFWMVKFVFRDGSGTISGMMIKKKEKKVSLELCQEPSQFRYLNPRQLAPLDVKEQRVYSKHPLDVQAPHPI